MEAVPIEPHQVWEFGFLHLLRDFHEMVPRATFNFVVWVHARYSSHDTLRGGHAHCLDAVHNV